MKRLLMTVALACLLSSSALAGDVPTVGAPQPPQGTTISTSPGEIPTSPGEVPSVGVAEQLSSDALSALLSVLGFLAA